MLLLSLIAFSIVVGWIRGGELSKFDNIDLRRIWMLVIAFGIHLFIIIFGASGNEFVLNYTKHLYLLSYILLIVYLFMNITNRHLIIVLIGVILNLIPFVFNDGKMPISIDALKLAGFSEIANLVESNKLALYTKLTENTDYGILSKIIVFGKPLPFSQVLTIGDILIGLGIFVFIQSVMLGLFSERRSGLRFR